MAWIWIQSSYHMNFLFDCSWYLSSKVNIYANTYYLYRWLCTGPLLFVSASVCVCVLVGLLNVWEDATLWASRMGYYMWWLKLLGWLAAKRNWYRGHQSMDITNISAALSSAKWMEVDKPLTDSHPSLFKGIRKQVLLYDAVGFLLYGVVVCGVCVCVLFFLHFFCIWYMLGHILSPVAARKSTISENPSASQPPRAFFVFVFCFGST